MPSIKMTKLWLEGKECACPPGKTKIVFHDTTSGVLYLRIRSSGAKSWFYRWYEGKTSRDRGLGPYPGVSLADARAKAQKMHSDRLAGITPPKQNTHPFLSSPTFKEAAEAYINSQESSDGTYTDLSRAGWKSPITARKWRNQLTSYVYPYIGKKVISEITEHDVRSILQQQTHKRATGRSKEAKGPLCNVKYDTASSIRGYIENILDDARQWRDGLENPAQSKFHKYLTKNAPEKQHQAALQYSELPDFMAELIAQKGMAARALELKIITGLRPGAETVVLAP